MGMAEQGWSVPVRRKLPSSCVSGESAAPASGKARARHDAYPRLVPHNNRTSNVAKISTTLTMSTRSLSASRTALTRMSRDEPGSASSSRDIRMDFGSFLRYGQGSDRLDADLASSRFPEKQPGGTRRRRVSSAEKNDGKTRASSEGRRRELFAAREKIARYGFAKRAPNSIRVAGRCGENDFLRQTR